MEIKQAAKDFFANQDIRSQAIADLAEIIEIPSVASAAEGIYPYGKECAKAIDKAAELAQKYGFATENHDYRCMSVLFGEGEEEIGIVCHLDVVPAGDGWSVDPYKLTVLDNILMGRGTHDDKGPFIQALYTLRFFKENNIKLPFRVRLILGSDEEVGSSDLDYFVKVRKPPMFSFTPDSEFPVCIGEKGILAAEVQFGDLPENILELQGGTVTNAVAGKAYAVVKTEKALLPAENIFVFDCDKGVKIEAVGKACHAAMPENGKSAISMLLGYLIDNGILPQDSYFGFLRTATEEYLGNSLGIAASNANFGYLTCVGGVIEVRNGKVVMHFNIRYLPDDDYRVIMANIQKSVEPFGGKAVVAEQSNGYFVSADDNKIKALTDACESVLGIECKPYTMGGGTYARWLPNTVAFGSAIEAERNYLGSERGNAHQRDEYISVKELFAGMEIYSQALANLAELF